MHTLYDVEAEVPAFVHITPANIHDTKAMSVIPYERGAHYIFCLLYTSDYDHTYNPKNNYPQLVEKQSFLLHFHRSASQNQQMYIRSLNHF